MPVKIDMWYCAFKWLYEETLEEWISERVNQISEVIILKVLQEIFCRLDYIHSREIIHYDIKPSNIFISTSGKLQVQLGDFSLASFFTKFFTIFFRNRYPMYAASEQLKGKCNPKSDSVGIILAQLLMTTCIQFITIIDSLKNGDIPEVITIEWHKLAYMSTEWYKAIPTKDSKSGSKIMLESCQSICASWSQPT